MAEPTGLPGATRVSSDQELREQMVTCQTCGEKGRVVSNRSGVNVFCNTCKIHWPISSVSLAKDLPVTAPRGLRKETIVEPDWTMAETEIGDASNEQVGPKRR
jgi:hypothetical protein